MSLDIVDSIIDGKKLALIQEEYDSNISVLEEDSKYNDPPLSNVVIN